MTREDFWWGVAATLVLMLAMALVGKVEAPQEYEDGSRSDGTCRVAAPCDDTGE